MINETSKAGELTKTDLKKQLKSAVVYFAPMVLIYISAVLGALQVAGHHFTLQDLIPSQLVIDGTVVWAMMQVQGLLIKWSSEGK